MIRLTNAYTDKPIWINPDHVVDIGEGICEGEKATYITTVCDVDADGVPMKVKESPSEVIRKALEWRLAMERYKALANALASASENLIAYNNELDEQEKTLLVLAGLEEQKDE